MRKAQRCRLANKEEDISTIQGLPILPPAEGVLLELDTGVRRQKLEWWGYRTEKEVDDIFSRLDTIHECDR